jgi:hypothetical protein
MVDDNENTGPISKNLKSAIVRENHLDFLYNLHLQGITIGIDNVNNLKSNGYIKEEVKPLAPPIFTDNVNIFHLETNTEEQKKIDANIDIVIESSPELTKRAFEILTDLELEHRRKSHNHIFEGRDTEIESHEWKPKSTVEHEQDFIDFINSINQLGFSNKVRYKKFSLYCQQAYTWLQDKKSHADFLDDDELIDYEDEEIRRCNENSLYLLNKYVYYKEGNVEEGKVKYIAAPAHEVLCYMNDCGYSLGLAKGRQMAATTTIMSLNMKDVIFKKNHFMKFVTEDDVKAKEIFEDKLKFAFSEMPWWLKPNVLNERDNLFATGTKPEKGTKEGAGARILVVVPKRTAIAGGAPQKVMIDEAGNIGILGGMLNNIRPTMLFADPTTRKIIVKRILWFWGTGGEMEKGGKSFEVELLSLFKQWNEGNYGSGIIPLFFDWTCRPYATQADYDREKLIAYSKLEQDEIEGQKAVTEFHQTWPNSLSDVFMGSSKTLVSSEYIEKAIQRIQKAKREHNYQLHQSGYFEPIFDINKPSQEGAHQPFKIIGANFIPTSDIDSRASTVIFMQPDKTWQNRYFKGTDPIDTDTGLSNFASTVWDKWFKTPVAIMNWRTRDYRDAFLQSLLLNLYYDTSKEQEGIWELVESNRGTSYTQYVETNGYGKKFVLNYQLPHAIQNRTTINEGVGIDNKGVRNTMIINHLHNLLSSYGDKIYLDIIFEQLKTFVCNVSDKGKEMWGPMNKKYFKDDTLFSTVFSYICAELCFYDLEPINTLKKSNGFRIEYKIDYDKDYKLVRKPIKVAN